MIFIYALYCPLTSRPRYVGKCKDTKSRLRAHISKARGLQTNHHCARWIRTLIKVDALPVLKIVKELPDDADWQSEEAEVIRCFRSEGHDLTNMTSGGDGFHDVDQDILKRRGRSRSKSLADPETNRRFRETLVKANSADDVRAKHRSVADRMWSDPVSKERMISGMRAPDAVERRSQATKKRNSDPVFAANHKEKMRIRFSDPAWLEHLKRAREKRWAR